MTTARPEPGPASATGAAPDPQSAPDPRTPGGPAGGPVVGAAPRSASATAPAKVNVQLAVGPVRPDGYHDLANVFLAVDMHDRVTVTEADIETGGVRVSCVGPGSELVPADATNLAWRAVELLAAHHGRRADVAVHIDKDIPVAGGMAGGSADAAAALLACDALWGTATPRDELLAIAAELGSDVPFSVVGGAALGRGRGEVLTELPVGGVFHWVFALADGGLSTPKVYGECDRLRGDTAVPEPEPAPELLAALRDGDAAGLAGALANDLQDAALSLRPALADTLAAGREAGALAALVSGSGPSCAFLAADADSAARVAAALAASGTCRAARVTTGPAP
ncbi:4-(cytidine 5'-diphospho)-2-C-methyl-D-erythritol kinase, partial [Streptomyces sp. ventii]|nr:4-(cytidine 5'-diphospho)-2-C-methyl-D-erythritol kinase [Streptomyces spiramenti]